MQSLRTHTELMQRQGYQPRAQVQTEDEGDEGETIMEWSIALMLLLPKEAGTTLLEEHREQVAFFHQ